MYRSHFGSSNSTLNAVPAFISEVPAMPSRNARKASAQDKLKEELKEELAALMAEVKKLKEEKDEKELLPASLPPTSAPQAPAQLPAGAKKEKEESDWSKTCQGQDCDCSGEGVAVKWKKNKGLCDLYMRWCAEKAEDDQNWKGNPLCEGQGCDCGGKGVAVAWKYNKARCQLFVNYCNGQ